MVKIKHDIMDLQKIEEELLDLRDVNLDVHHKRAGITRRSVCEDTTEAYRLEAENVQHKVSWFTSLTNLFLTFLDRLCCVRSQDVQDHPEIRIQDIE